MTIQTLTAFFMWCCILNGAILLIWTPFILFAPDFLYRTQSRWIDIPRPTYDILIWSSVAAFKLLFIVFSLVPYLALLLLTR
jgi:hypothetical protein